MMTTLLISLLFAQADAPPPLPYLTEGVWRYDNSEGWEDYWREWRRGRIEELEEEAANQRRRSAAQREANARVTQLRRWRRPDRVHIEVVDSPIWQDYIGQQTLVGDMAEGETVWIDAHADQAVSEEAQRLADMGDPAGAQQQRNQCRTTVTEIIDETQFAAFIEYQTSQFSREDRNAFERAFESVQERALRQQGGNVFTLHKQAVIFQGFETGPLSVGDVISYGGLFTIAEERDDGTKVIRPYARDTRRFD